MRVKSWAPKKPKLVHRERLATPVVQAIGVTTGYPPVLMTQDGQAVMTSFAPAAGSEYVQVVNTFAELKALPGGTEPEEAVIMNGYYTPGDGAGGTFAWNGTIESGDNIITVQPTGVAVGAWVRVFDGAVNVKWGGAYGDGIHDDTAAIQAVLNVSLPTPQRPAVGFAGITIFCPAGSYLLTAPENGVALQIGNTLTLNGDLVGTEFIVNSATAGATAGSGILIENYVGKSAENTQISNIFFTSSGNLPKNVIVVHASFCTLTNLNFVNACALNGVMIESGLTVANPGHSFGSNLLNGPSFLAAGTYLLSDNCVAQNCAFYESPSIYNYTTTVTESFVQPPLNTNVNITVADSTQLYGAYNFVLTLPIDEQEELIGVYVIVSINSPTSITAQIMPATGNSGSGSSGGPSGPNPIGSTVPPCNLQAGAGFYAQGPDSGAGLFSNLTGELQPISFKEMSQVSNTWVQCYSEDSRLGYFCSSDIQPVLVHCGSEDYDVICTTSGGALVIGAELSSKELPISVESVGNSTSKLTFERSASIYGGPNTTYIVGIPQVNENAFFGLVLTDSVGTIGWNFQYDLENGPAYPFNTNVLLWDSNTIYGGNWGWTTARSSRGNYLGINASASMNTQRHWKWKQSITLAPGSNIVYLNGGSSDAGAFVFCDDGTGPWALAQSAVSIQIEYGNLSDLTASSCYVSGYAFLPETGGRNVVCNVQNTGDVDVTVNLVWSFDMFVTNYDSDSGEIG